MKIVYIALAVVLMTACTNRQNKETTSLFPKGELIDNTHFSGKAWVSRLVTDKENFDLTVGNVLFEPGTRTSWHLHPGGQILICTNGHGCYQEEGKPIQLLKKGDVVEIFPNIVHWHGASPDSEFEHIAIGAQSGKGAVEWLQAVTDEEYKLSKTSWRKSQSASDVNLQYCIQNKRIRSQFLS